MPPCFPSRLRPVVQPDESSPPCPPGPAPMLWLSVMLALAGLAGLAHAVLSSEEPWRRFQSLAGELACSPTLFCSVR